VITATNTEKCSSLCSLCIKWGKYQKHNLYVMGLQGQNVSINEINWAVFILAHYSVSWHFTALYSEWWRPFILYDASECQAVNKNYKRHNTTPKCMHSYIHCFGFTEAYKLISILFSWWYLMMTKGLPKSFQSLHSFWSYFLILWESQIACAVLTIMCTK